MKNKSRNGLNATIAGAILGCGFFVLNFPMLVLTFAVGFGLPLRMVITNEASNFVDILPAALMMTVIPGAVIGMIGSFIFSKKLENIIAKPISY